MGDLKAQFGFLNDGRLSAHALMPTPVWLFAADGRRLLWANPVGAAIFEAASSAEAEALTFDGAHPAATQIARLAMTLSDAAPRLERLRGFGARLGGVLICLCSRIVLANTAQGVLVVSTERAGTELPLAERAQRLLGGFAHPAAIFTADGEKIASTPQARDILADRQDIIALGADRVARGASMNGVAEGESVAGPIAIMKLGAGSTVALLVLFTPPAVQAPPRIDAPPVQAAATDAGPVQSSPVPQPATPANDDTGRPRMLPLRFVWQMDATTHFTAGADDFARLIGPESAPILTHPWHEIAGHLGLDPEGHVARAIDARETWSGITVYWPLPDTGERIAIEMSGLPVFDRDRVFGGYRGFALCREREKLSATPVAALPTPANDASATVLSFPAVTPPELTLVPQDTQHDEPVFPPRPDKKLSADEQSNFQALARELSARLKNPPPPTAEEVSAMAPVTPPAAPSPVAREGHDSRPILDRLPVGLLVYRLNNLLYANRAFLDWTGYPTLDALNDAGGLESLFLESKDSGDNAQRNGGKSLSIATVNGKQKAVEGKLFSIPWNGENALVLMIHTQPPVNDERAREQTLAAEAQVRERDNEIGTLNAVLDTAVDGVLLLDRAGRVLSANRSAQALFGYAPENFVGMSLSDLLAPESRRAVMDTLERIARERGALDAGREVLGRVRQGGVVPLTLSLGRIEGDDKLCAVLRDITAWKRTEEDLIRARREAEKASTAKSEFLAKISHEIRTPLNAIIGFSEVMMDERFGAIGNDRYKQYLRDIHASGGHLVSLLNDLLDLSKIEAGKLDLTFVNVDLNMLVQQCVAIMQEEANRARIIIRTSLPPNLPQIVADARSVRQIALNVLSNAIKFTGAGGQVIVSTTLDDNRNVVLHMRDTGAGMSEQELETALEPFRQIATASRWGATGTGLGLPITKALAEANNAQFRISSRVDDGTLVEIAFSAARVLA